MGNNRASKTVPLHGHSILTKNCIIMKAKRLLLLLSATLLATTIFAKGTQIGDLNYELYDSDLTAIVCYQTRTAANYETLTSINIPATVAYNSKTYKVTAIEELAFAGAPKLEAVYAANNITVIGKQAFLDCKKLNHLYVGRKVTSIGLNALRGCTQLHTVDWCAENYPDFSYKNSPFCHAEGDAWDFDIREFVYDVIFGSYVKHIPANLCFGMKYLKAIVLPNSVTSIGANAFYGCNNLTTTTVTLPNSVTEIETDVFANTNLTAPVYNNRLFVYMPPTLENTSYTVPDGIETIIGEAFYACNNLQTVTLPNSVKTIGVTAFSNCSNLKTVELGNSLEVIEAYAFEECSKLQAITLPNTLKRIFTSAFGNCSSLKSINFPNSIIECGSAVFAGTGLDAAVYNEHIYAYQPANLLATAVTIPDGIELIAGDAFFECSEMREVIIPASLDSIGDGAFYGCTGLTALTCKAVTPPTLHKNNVFYGAPTTATLYVPEGSVDAYKATKWNYFTTILPIQSTGMGQLSTSKVVDGKLIHNGQLLIIRDGKIFNAAGIEVK